MKLPIVTDYGMATLSFFVSFTAILFLRCRLRVHRPFGGGVTELSDLSPKKVRGHSLGR